MARSPQSRPFAAWHVGGRRMLASFRRRNGGGSHADKPTEGSDRSGKATEQAMGRPWLRPPCGRDQTARFGHGKGALQALHFGAHDAPPEVRHAIVAATLV